MESIDYWLNIHEKLEHGHIGLFLDSTEIPFEVSCYRSNKVGTGTCLVATMPLSPLYNGVSPLGWRQRSLHVSKSGPVGVYRVGFTCSRCVCWGRVFQYKLQFMKLKHTQKVCFPLYKINLVHGYPNNELIVL